ncbi:MAG: ribonuclease HII [Candidatus Magasanikbacteria bacterium]
MDKYIIGVDEAGRGAIGGPVTAGAVLVPSSLSLKNLPRSGLRDSKKYTFSQREEWLNYIKGNSSINFEFSSVWPTVIDRINVFESASRAATRAVNRVIDRNKIDQKRVEIVLDGSLKLNSQDLDYEVITRGDQKRKSIKLASIVAKVKRDQSMIRVSRKYPDYKFAKHKGYCTEEHEKLLKKNGPCKYHRRTFIQKIKT